MLQAWVITSSSSSDFTRRSSFTSGVTFPTLAPGSGLLEVEDGLAPRASADAEPPDVAKRASGGREQRLAVVGLVDDDGLPRLAPFEVEDEHHPRQHVERLAPRREEGADDPAVGVGGLTEARHVPGEPGEVLEVGRRLQKDRVDACLVEPRREDLAATCELGLGERLVHHGCILPRLDWPRCPLSSVGRAPPW